MDAPTPRKIAQTTTAPDVVTLATPADSGTDGRRVNLFVRRVPRWLEAIFASSVRQRVQAITIALAILAATGWLAYRGVLSSLVASRELYLRTLVDAKASSLQVWFDDKHQEAERWARVPDVRQATRELAAIARSTSEVRPADDAEIARALTSAAGQRRLRVLNTAILDNDLERGAIKAVALDGRIIVSHDPSHTGLIVDDSVRAELASVFAGGTRFIRPRASTSNALGAPAAVAARPVLWFAAPVRDDDGHVVAALAIGSWADARFARLLAPRVPAIADALADPGSSDAYAFDRRGILLTSSRYTPAGDTPQRPSPGLSVPLRDPGEGEGAAGDRPLTQLVQAAIDARDDAAAGAAARPQSLSGVLARPYRNYAGREVIGAWRWLPEVGVGVAVEVAPDEVYSATQYVRLAMQLFAGMIVIAVVVTLGSTLSLAGLLRERRRLGPYRLHEVIAEGGMATIYRAEHALLKRPTAVKVLKRHLATDELIARFEREVTLTSRLQHPCTVEIYDYGLTRDGSFYFAMEHIDGLTLERLIAVDGPQPAARVAHIMKHVCESLREAHGKGLIHRDVKPNNIMLCERGGEADVVKVVDWGLIKDLHTSVSRDLTRQVRVLGTPDYMAPERIKDSAHATPQVDFYGVGAVAYFLLTGRRLFEAPNAFELQKMVIEREAPRASLLAKEPLPAALDDLIARCLSKDPAVRPRDADELITVFDDLLQSAAWSTERAAHWWRSWRAREMLERPSAPGVA